MLHALHDVFTCTVCGRGRTPMFTVTRARCSPPQSSRVQAHSRTLQRRCTRSTAHSAPVRWPLCGYVATSSLTSYVQSPTRVLVVHHSSLHRSLHAWSGPAISTSARAVCHGQWCAPAHSHHHHHHNHHHCHHHHHNLNHFPPPPPLRARTSTTSHFPHQPAHSLPDNHNCVPLFCR
jgi:hypothetical protein